MAFLNARVTGIHETKAALRRIERRADRLDLYDASKILADEARHTAPRRTGKLSRLQVLQTGGVRSPVRYARYVHWGTRRRRKQDMQPFIIEAMTRKLPEMIEALEDQLGDEIRRAGFRQRRR